MLDLAAARAKLEQFEKGSPEYRETEELLRELDALLEANPLQGFFPHSEAQRLFLEASDPVQAAFAGNRFGKTTSLVVKALVQLVRPQVLPEHLRPYRLVDGERAWGRIVCPDASATMEGVVLPALRKWAPKSELAKGSFDRAWDKQHRTLRFANGSFLQLMTYEQDVDKFGGASLDFVGYDEPPPEAIRNECAARLIDRGGFEVFAMTPLMGMGWVYREIWKKRESPGITVVTGSIHDNPLLDQEAKTRFLERFPEGHPERESREFGRFAHFGGMVFPRGLEDNLVEPPSTRHVQGLDVVVGIDPGMRNAAFTWTGFDRDNVALTFDEALVREGTPDDYVRKIREVNERWGIKEPLYVIDPSARNRAQVNAENVQGALWRLGVVTTPGQNQVEAGVQQMRLRLAERSWLVSNSCRGLRDEAEEYRMDDRADGVFAVVRENNHRLDAQRYALMSRVYFASDEQTNHRPLGYMPDWEGPYKHHYEADSPPLGAMS